MKRTFDWMARPYAALENLLFGGTFQGTRVALLPVLDDSRRVLVLGEGDGRFVAALLARNPHATAVVVDGSQEMLHEATRRCKTDAKRVRFVCTNAVDWLETAPEAGHFDAIVTTFFLDCLTESEVCRLFAAVGRHLAPHACWLWADLVVPPRGWQRVFAKWLLRSLYAVFALTTNITARRLVDPRPYFEAYGWSAQRSTHALAGALASSAFFRSSPKARASQPQVPGVHYLAE